MVLLIFRRGCLLVQLQNYMCLIYWFLSWGYIIDGLDQTDLPIVSHYMFQVLLYMLFWMLLCPVLVIVCYLSISYNCNIWCYFVYAWVHICCSSLGQCDLGISFLSIFVFYLEWDSLSCEKFKRLLLVVFFRLKYLSTVKYYVISVLYFLLIYLPLVPSFIDIILFFSHI